MTPETSLLNAIGEYLTLKRHFFFRVNTIPVFSNGQYRAMGKWTMKGCPDFILVRKGLFYGLEAKSAKGTTSTHQNAFKANVERVGGLYAVIRSVDDLIKLGL